MLSRSVIFLNALYVVAWLSPVPGHFGFQTLVALGAGLLSVFSVCGVWVVKRIENVNVVEIFYCTQRRLLCFSRFRGNGSIADEWLRPEDVGLAKNSKHSVYMNKTTGEEFMTVGKGEWSNEEFFLYLITGMHRKQKKRVGGSAPQNVRIIEEAKREQEQAKLESS